MPSMSILGWGGSDDGYIKKTPGGSSIIMPASHITNQGAVCVKYLQTFSLSTNNNVYQHCSHENRVFANIPSDEGVYFCIT
jgi:hypothetical protein